VLTPAMTCCCLVGDHVGMYARNSADVVADAARCLGMPLETMFSLHTDGEGAK